MTTKVQLRRVIDGGMEDINPMTSEECVMLEDGKKLKEVVDFVVTTEDFEDEDFTVEENLVDRVESIENRIDSEFEQQNSQIATGLSNIKTVEQNISNKVDTEVAKVNAQLSDIEVSVKDFGAKGDGITDDAPAIQRALDYVHDKGGGTVSIPAGNYLVSVHVDGYTGNYLKEDSKIQIKSNTTLKISDNATIKAKSNACEQYNILAVVGQENVKISGGKIIGDRNEHTGTTGEWGYGIEILGSSNIIIENVTISDCWGDGINIQVYNGVSCQNVHINNVICDNNRRQGMSVEGAIDMYVSNSKFINTSGTDPQCGVDIEPWSSDNICKNIHFDNCYFGNNNAGGLLIMTPAVSEVYVNNCIFDKNKSAEGNLLISSGPKVVKVANCIFYGDLGRFTNASNGIEVDNCTGDSGFALYGCEEVTFTNNKFTLKKSNWEVFVARDGCNKLTFKNNSFKGFLANSLSEYLMDISANELIFTNNQTSYGERVALSGGKGHINNNTFECITNVIALRFNTQVFIDNNIFRAIGYGSEVLYSNVLKNAVICNNVVSVNVTDDEKEFGITERASAGSFLNLYSSDVSNYENISLVNNVGVYKANSTMTPYEATGDVSGKVNVVEDANVTNLTNAYGTKSKRIVSLFNNSVYNKNYIFDLFLKSTSNKKYTHYLITILLAPGWATKQRTGTVEIKITVAGDSSLAIYDITCVNSNRDSLYGYRISQLYQKDGKWCISITSADGEEQSENIQITVEDLQSKTIDASAISLVKDVPNTEQPAELTFKHILPVYGACMSTLPTSDKWYIENGCTILYTKTKQQLTYYSGAWYDSTGAVVNS